MTYNQGRPSQARIMIVEDDVEMCRLLTQMLTEEGYSVAAFADGYAALENFRQGTFQLVITDLEMPTIGGNELVKRLREVDPEALILVITAFGSVESAVETMRDGAFNYLTKPFRTEEILLAVSRALETHGLKQEVRRLKKEVSGRYEFEHIIGRSAGMQRVLDLITQIVDAPANVLITGESGTGKDVIAKAIHYNSHLRDGPFVAVNCAAIPETLLESELFGYVRGAFTDAKRDHRGLFQEASGGTLFLDEIVEISLALQAKLLRAIQDKDIRPVGGNKTEKVDVRILAATNRRIEESVDEGRFRQDLFYRLNVIRIELPPLRERREDIPLLAQHFLEKFGTDLNRPGRSIDPHAMEALINYPWPGNVRELEHTLERAILLSRHSTITRDDLSTQIVASSRHEVSLAEALSQRYTLRELEWAYIQRVLEATRGNKTEAATILGVDRTTLYRKIEEEEKKNDHTTTRPHDNAT